MGETRLRAQRLQRWPPRSFSILERIDVGETWCGYPVRGVVYALSVSSNGSTWVKRAPVGIIRLVVRTFSILERIDVGETSDGG